MPLTPRPRGEVWDVCAIVSVAFFFFVVTAVSSVAVGVASPLQECLPAPANPAMPCASTGPPAEVQATGPMYTLSVVPRAQPLTLAGGSTVVVNLTRVLSVSSAPLTLSVQIVNATFASTAPLHYSSYLVIMGNPQRPWNTRPDGSVDPSMRLSIVLRDVLLFNVQLLIRDVVIASQPVFGAPSVAGSVLGITRLTAGRSLQDLTANKGAISPALALPSLHEGSSATADPNFQAAVVVFNVSLPDFTVSECTLQCGLVAATSSAASAGMCCIALWFPAPFTVGGGAFFVINNTQLIASVGQFGSARAIHHGGTVTVANGGAYVLANSKLAASGANAATNQRASDYAIVGVMFNASCATPRAASPCRQPALVVSNGSVLTWANCTVTVRSGGYGGVHGQAFWQHQQQQGEEAATTPTTSLTAAAAGGVVVDGGSYFLWVGCKVAAAGAAMGAFGQTFALPVNVSRGSVIYWGGNTTVDIAVSGPIALDILSAAQSFLGDLSVSLQGVVAWTTVDATLTIEADGYLAAQQFAGATVNVSERSAIVWDRCATRVRFNGSQQGTMSVGLYGQAFVAATALASRSFLLWASCTVNVNSSGLVAGQGMSESIAQVFVAPFLVSFNSAVLWADCTLRLWDATAYVDTLSSGLSIYSNTIAAQLWQAPLTLANSSAVLWLRTQSMVNASRTAAIEHMTVAGMSPQATINLLGGGVLGFVGSVVSVITVQYPTQQFLAACLLIDETAAVTASEGGTVAIASSNCSVDLQGGGTSTTGGVSFPCVSRCNSFNGNRTPWVDLPVSCQSLPCGQCSAPIDCAAFVAAAAGQCNVATGGPAVCGCSDGHGNACALSSSAAVMDNAGTALDLGLFFTRAGDRKQRRAATATAATTASRGSGTPSPTTTRPNNDEAQHGRRRSVTQQQQSLLHATVPLPATPLPLPPSSSPPGAGAQRAVAAVVSSTMATATAATATTATGSVGAAVGPGVAAQAARSGLLASLGQCPGGTGGPEDVAPDAVTYLYSTPGESPSTAWPVFVEGGPAPPAVNATTAVTFGSVVAAHASGVLVTSMAIALLVLAATVLVMTEKPESQPELKDG